MLFGKRTVAALLIVSLMSCTAFAQGRLNDWRNVESLEIGTRLIVKTKDGARMEGDLKSKLPDSIFLIVDISRSYRDVIELRQYEIKEIRKVRSRAVSTLLGVGIGVGVGAGIGAISEARAPYNDDPGLAPVLLGFLGGLLGGPVGNKLFHKGKKVYVAP